MDRDSSRCRRRTLAPNPGRCPTHVPTGDTDHEPMTDCVYCGCEAEAHDPVYVRHDGAEDAYCNYGCLSAHIQEAELATGTSCNWNGAATDRKL
jgi:hypothetical protein